MDTARQSAIVTGAASGLGRAIAVRLAREGWRIAIADIDSRASEETLRMVESAGGAGHVEHLDVARLADWQALSERLRAAWPRLDLLVNNAGVAGCGNVGVYPLEDWHWLLDINLYGGIYGCHTLVDWLKSNPAGSHIINTASFAAIAPSPAMAAYSVSKAGMVALSEALYTELKPHNVGVTVICPMFFRTRIGETARSYDDVRAEMIEQAIEQSTLTADIVADCAIRAMHRKQLYAIPGRRARWYWWLKRLMPTGFLNGISRDVTQHASAKADASNAAGK